MGPGSAGPREEYLLITYGGQIPQRVEVELWCIFQSVMSGLARMVHRPSLPDLNELPGACLHKGLCLCLECLVC